MTNEATKDLRELVAELRHELKAFAATRLALLRGEISEKVTNIKFASPGIIGGLVLVATSWLLFTAFLVCAIASIFPNIVWKYAIAFLIVGGLYATGGSIALFLGWQKLRETPLRPERTIRVLKEDKIWLQTEVKTQS